MGYLAEAHKWSGEFFLPDKFDERFGGVIEYSPERGVVFTYTQILNTQSPPDSTWLRSFDRLFGVLETGETCTLLYSTISKNDFPMEIYRGGVGFKVLLVGEHILEENFVSQAEFSLIGINDIIDISDVLRAGNTAIADFSAPFGSCRLCTRLINCNELSKYNITDFIFHPEKAAVDELANAINEIGKKYKTKDRFFNNPCHIGNKEIMFQLKFNQLLSIAETYEIISKIIHLMSLLRYCPTYPEYFTVRNKEEQYDIKVYPSLAIDTMSIEHASQKRNFLPINYQSVSLQDILSKWFEISDYAGLISSLVEENKQIIDRTSVYSKLIILAVFFESISNEFNKNKVKYEYPFEHYASDKLKKFIFEVGGKTNLKDIGKYIGDLRDGIAHLKAERKAKLVKEAPLEDLISIVMVMELICISHIFAKMDIQKEVYRKYQDCLMGSRYLKHQIK